MSFPGQKARDPWRSAQAVENAGFVQDVVIATTRLLHEVALSNRQRKALSRCQDLLRRAESGRYEEAHGNGEGQAGEPQLEPSASGESFALLRAARTVLPKDEASFAEILKALDSVLADEDLSGDELKLIVNLREMFVAIGKANLHSLAATRHSEGDLGLWEPLMTSSLS